MGEKVNFCIIFFYNFFSSFFFVFFYFYWFFVLEFSIGVQRKGEKTKKKKKNAFCQHSLDVVSYPPPPPRPPSILLPLPYFNWFKLLCDIVESGPTKRERERTRWKRGWAWKEGSFKRRRRKRRNREPQYWTHRWTYILFVSIQHGVSGDESDERALLLGRSAIFRCVCPFDDDVWSIRFDWFLVWGQAEERRVKKCLFYVFLSLFLSFFLSVLETERILPPTTLSY